MISCLSLGTVLLPKDSWDVGLRLRMIRSGLARDLMMKQEKVYRVLRLGIGGGDNSLGDFTLNYTPR